MGALSGIQTIEDVTVAPSGQTTSDWIDTSGFREVAITISVDTSASHKVEVLWSHNGVNVHGEEVGIPTTTDTASAGLVSTKARYCKIVALNKDAVQQHIISAYAYLKA